MDPRKSRTADLSLISPNVVDTLLMDSTTDHSLFEEIARDNTHRPEILSLFASHPLAPESVRKFSAQALQLSVTTASTIDLETQKRHARRKTQTLLQRIQTLGTGEKMQLANKGSREIRSILLRDPREEIMVAVLHNPRITISEVELLTKQKNTSSEILREIARNKTWLRSYSVVHCLVGNPKTPLSISLKHIVSIRSKHLKLIQKDKNLPDAVRAHAKKLLAARK